MTYKIFLKTESYPDRWSSFCKQKGGVGDAMFYLMQSGVGDKSTAIIFDFGWHIQTFPKF
jgi:hypothetical protein